MTKYADIIGAADLKPGTRYGLVYTCNCGWVDVGHASPQASRPTEGAINLWQAIQDEAGELSQNGLWHRVNYSITMTKWEIGERRSVAVRRGLSQAQKESVALNILTQVSHDFEELQSSWPISWRTDSGYSVEDLVSNLIGFYRAVKGVDWVKECQPVSKAAAQYLWKRFGPVGETKNRTFRPRLLPCVECKGGPQYYARWDHLPPAFATVDVSAAKRGADFRPWNVHDPALYEPPPPPPSGPPITLNYWIVQRGESLSGIAKASWGNYDYWPLLWDANRGAVGDNPNRLKPETRLLIPPISRYSAAELAAARRRAPSWKSYPP
jgi:hypothetical protein